MVTFNTPPDGIDSVTWDYLYQLSEKLNLLVDYYGSNSIGNTVVNTGSSGSSNQFKKSDGTVITREELTNEYNELKALIIKAAEHTARGVSSIIEQYYLSDSPYETTGGSWLDESPTWDSGKYMFTRSFITFTDGTTSTTEQCCVTGNKGDGGDTGVGVSEVDVEYYISTDPDTPTGGEWITTVSSFPSDKYIFTRTKVTYTSGNVEYTSVISASKEIDSVVNERITDIDERLTQACTDLGKVENTVGTMKDDYVAKSVFGTYQQSVTQEFTDTASFNEKTYSTKTELSTAQSSLEGDISIVDGKANSVTSNFNTYKSQTEQSIRQGVVDYDGATPIVGIAIANNLSTETVDGQTVVLKRGFRSVFTAEKLSFWVDETEVAYISNQVLHINRAVINDMISMGNWDIGIEDGFSINWRG